MNGNTFAGDFIIGFVSKHRRVSVMFSDNYLPRGGVSWWIIYASVDHHVKNKSMSGTTEEAISELWQALMNCGLLEEISDPKTKNINFQPSSISDIDDKKGSDCPKFLDRNEVFYDSEDAMALTHRVDRQPWTNNNFDENFFFLEEGNKRSQLVKAVISEHLFYRFQLIYIIRFKNDRTVGANADHSCSCNSMRSICSSYEQGRLYVINMTTHVASCALQTCRKSPVFCKRFLRYIQHNSVHAPDSAMQDSKENVERATLKMNPVDVYAISIQWPERCKLDMTWFVRLNSLTTRRILLDDAMNWLNTLGGGYSALGDYFEYHAIEAGRISFKQLKIADEMGDVINANKCRLYFSLSLMQTGYLRFSAKLIRAVYGFAVSHGRDEKLINMCRGVWSRLQYFYTLKKSVKNDSQKKDYIKHLTNILDVYK